MSETQNVGRPREFDEQNVLDKVMKLFWENGYEATGLNDILKTTGLGKGSIYKAFKNKHSLYLRSLERYEELFVTTAAAALKSDADPMSRIDSFLSSAINTSAKGGNKGCFLCNASADYADADEATSQRVRRGFQKLSEAIIFPISELKPNWTQDQKHQTAQMILSIYSGMRIISRSGIAEVNLEGAKNGALYLLSQKS